MLDTKWRVRETSEAHAQEKTEWRETDRRKPQYWTKRQWLKFVTIQELKETASERLKVNRIHLTSNNQQRNMQCDRETPELKCAMNEMGNSVSSRARTAGGTLKRQAAWHYPGWGLLSFSVGFSFLPKRLKQRKNGSEPCLTPVPKCTTYLPPNKQDHSFWMVGVGDGRREQEGDVLYRWCWWRNFTTAWSYIRIWYNTKESNTSSETRSRLKVTCEYFVC